MYIYDRQSQDDRSHVISFDLKEEEFGLKNPPISIGNPLKRDISRDYDQLIKLNGQVGYFCNRTMEVWVLNHKKEWVPHCRMDDLSNQWLDVFGCLNKDGGHIRQSCNRLEGSFLCLQHAKWECR